VLAALLVASPLPAPSAPPAGNPPPWRPAQRAQLLGSLDGLFGTAAFAQAGIIGLAADARLLYQSDAAGEH